MKWDPTALKDEAKKEAYKLIDKNHKKLPKNSDGSINEFGAGLDDNDIDALRHAYASGVFTLEYGETAADLFGRAYEFFPFMGTSSSNSTNSTNMDLWNNSIGRKYGKKVKTRKDLFKNLIKALNEGELIIDPENDSRKYLGESKINSDVTNLVIVLDENKNGKNRIFFDLDKKKTMKKDEFVALIKNGFYSNYEIRIIHGEEIPAAKKDPIQTNNLG